MIRGDTGATVQGASRTSVADGPEPGHLKGGALGGDGRPSERSEGERTGPEHQVSIVDDRQGMPAQDAGGDLGQSTRTRARGDEGR